MKHCALLQFLFRSTPDSKWSSLRLETMWLVDWVFRVTEKSKKNIAQNLLKFVKLSDSGVKLKKEVKI